MSSLHTLGRWGLVCVAVLLSACEGSTERRLFEACESTPQCTVGLDCVVLRADPNGTTAGAGFCTSRCAIRFPCSPTLACTPVDREGIIVAPGADEARNAFCLEECADDADCPAGLTCELSPSGLVCI
ncbi:MAG: hypothetical protein R3B40_23100 [Polyangiales bacterium]|nr:hypothetical protein [Myxococcales bacterium]MCB9661491.1 hypothetical protein [Sandaracinaceae bacterium]